MAKRGVVRRKSTDVSEKHRFQNRCRSVSQINQHDACCLLHAGLLGLLFNHEDRNGMFLRNVHLFNKIHNLQFLNSPYKSCSVRVFRTACDSGSIISVVSKWRPSIFNFNRGYKKNRVGGGRHSCCFGVEGSLVTKKAWDGASCVVAMQQPVLLSPKFEAKSSHIFTQSPWNVTVVCGTDCLACQDEFFVNNPLDVKENDGHALDFALHLFRLFRSASLDFLCTANAFLSERLPNHCQGLLALYPRIAHNRMHTGCSSVASMAKSHH
jgi:hypothetical protein